MFSPSGCDVKLYDRRRFFLFFPQYFLMIVQLEHTLSFFSLRVSVMSVCSWVKPCVSFIKARTNSVKPNSTADYVTITTFSRQHCSTETNNKEIFIKKILELKSKKKQKFYLFIFFVRLAFLSLLSPICFLQI